jgi:hypothetical protein
MQVLYGSKISPKVRQDAKDRAKNLNKLGMANNKKVIKFDDLFKRQAYINSC